MASDDRPRRLSRLWLDLPIGRKALAVIAIPVLPLILTAGLYFQSASAYDDARALADRSWSNRVLQAQIETDIIEAESTIRGYLLGRDPLLLEQHARIRNALATDAEALEASTTATDQRQYLPRLRELIAARVSALDAVMREDTATGLNSPQMLAHVARGAALMDELRHYMATMREANMRTVEARADLVRRLQDRSDAIVFIGATSGAIGGLAAALLFTAGITRRLSAATLNVGRLSRGEPLLAVAPSHDEIGTLSIGTERAAALLAARDRQLAERMAELESLTRELEAFSYSVSHDLRAPLRHVVGFASMLQKSAGDALTEQQRRYVKTIVDAAARMGHLIDDLLAFSRTSRSELRRTPVDVNAIVRDVQGQLSSELNGRRLRWIVHPLPRVEGDPAMLRVVFDNLLANAVKYTRLRDDAEVEIGSRPGDDGQAVVYVRDNGVGFDMQYQSKLFGVFQRLHSSDDFEGTGIGLATVRRIVTRHGGRAWAEGRPGEGATFYVSLPVQEPA